MYSHVEGDESVEVVYLVDWLDLMHKQYLSKGHAEFTVWLNKLGSTYEVWELLPDLLYLCCRFLPVFVMLPFLRLA